MGEEITRTESEREQTESKSTITTEAERDRDRGRRRRTRTRTTEEKETGMGILLVESSEPQKVEIPEPNEPKKKTKKVEIKTADEVPQKPKRKRKKKDEQPDTTQLDLMLATVSGIIASRPDCEHWLLSEKEIKSITEPLARILAENENLKAIGEHADAIALVMACFTIVVPRMIITSQKVREKKKHEPDTKQQKREINGDSKPVIKQSTNTNAKLSTNLSFLGDAIG